MRQLKIKKQITRRDNTTQDIISKKNTELNSHSMKNEIHLLKQINKGDLYALEVLTATKQCYVTSIAKKFIDNGFTLHQLIIKGNQGLKKAIEHFDETKGYQFTSYMIWCIRQSIIEAFAEERINKPIPLTQIGLISRPNNQFTKLEQYCKREPSKEDIVGILKFEAKIRMEVSLSKVHINQ